LCILSKGIEELCKRDENIKTLIAPEKIETLISYIKEIETFNPAYGLVGTSDRNELIIKHILDSLAPLGIISRFLGDRMHSIPPKRIADAGSGAGLPGIPLAIALSDCDFTLIERMGRRAGFLLNTKAVLSIQNINIEEKELERVTGAFDLITFRAFKPLEPKLLKTLLKLCAPKGIIAAYKGRREKIDEEMSVLQKSNTNKLQWEAVPCPVPFLDEERHLLIIHSCL